MKVFQSRSLVVGSRHAWVLVAATAFTACIDDEPGIVTATTGGHAAAGRNSENHAGNAAGGAAGAEPKAGRDTGGSTGGKTDASGATTTGGTKLDQGGDAPLGGDGDGSDVNGGGAGGADEDGVHIQEACVFHSAAVAPSGGAGGTANSGGTGGVGGAANVGNITVEVSAFIGTYLADSA